MSTVNLREGVSVNLINLNETPAVTSLSPSDIVAVASGDKIKNITYANFISPLSGGIGNAIPSTVPSPGVNTYNANQAGTYTNFGGIVVVSEEMSEGIVQLRKTGSVWTKIIVPISGFEDKVDIAEFEPVKEKTDMLIPIQDIDWVYVITDSESRLLCGFRTDGSFVVSKWGDNTVDGAAIKIHSVGPDQLTQEVKNGFWTTLDPTSGYVCAILDSNNRKLLAIRTDGGAEISGIDIKGLNNRLSVIESVVDTTFKVMCWGDSLTAGAHGGGVTYPNTLQTLVPDNYTVVNCGVGGEDVNSIAARQGGIPAFIVDGFTLPADGSTVQVFTTAAGTQNKYGKIIRPLLQGDGSGSVNPCYIAGIECTLSYVADNPGVDPFTGKFYLKRNAPSSAHMNIPAMSKLVFAGNLKRKESVNIYWMGENGGFDGDNAKLVAHYKDMVAYNMNSNYLIIGLHSGTATSQADMETALQNEFGNHFFNWRQYVSTYGCEDAGITPTTDDITAMAAGSIPPSLLYDNVHMIGTGYAVLGRAVYRQLQMIGLFN